MNPSSTISQINDRKFLLPADFENKYNINLRRKRPKSSYFNTAQRVFTEYVLTTVNHYNTDNFDFNSENTNPNYRKSVGSVYKRNNDSVGNLLEYKYAPEFKDQVNLFILEIIFY